MIIVDLVSNGCDQLDDSLGIVVAWGSLTTDGNDSWDELVSSLVLGSVEDLKVSVNDVQNVHELSLVLVYSLDLNIIKGIERNIETGVLLNPCSQLGLVLPLDFDESVLKGLVGCVWSELLEVLKGSDPFVNSAEGITNQIRKGWVAAVDPSSWGDTIGLILKFTLIKVVEFLENSFL